MTSLLAAVVGAGLAHALPPAPAPISVTDEEAAQLAAGEIVVRYPGPGKETTAVVEIAADPATVMRQVMDLQPRMNEIGGVKSLDVYIDEPGHKAARWDVGIAFIGAVFSIDYEYDTEAGWCVYKLDESRPDNTIQQSNGSYQVYAHGGGSRMVYRSLSIGSAGTPDWVRKKLAFSSARELLGGIKGRAEGQ
jgi:hypothetical protein